jgi:hypothetical protein
MFLCSVSAYFSRFFWIFKSLALRLGTPSRFDNAEVTSMHMTWSRLHRSSAIMRTWPLLSRCLRLICSMCCPWTGLHLSKNYSLITHVITCIHSFCASCLQPMKTQEHATLRPILFLFWGFATLRTNPAQEFGYSKFELGPKILAHPSIQNPTPSPTTATSPQSIDP